MKHYLLISSCLILMLTVIIGCANTTSTSESDMKQSSDATGGLRIPAIELPDHSENLDMIELQQSEINVPLSFHLVNSEQQIQLITSIDYANIIKEQSVTIGTVIIYSKKDDNEYIYGAYRSDKGTLYDLGIVGGLSSQLDEEVLSIKQLSLFNKSLVRINGVFGANAPIHNYYSIEDGTIIPFLRVDTGHAKELDLDGDGTFEVVSSHGTPISTYIYKWEDGKFSVANVNESLDGTSVYLNEDNKFNVHLEMGSDITTQYEYKAGIMKPLNEVIKR